MADMHKISVMISEEELQAKISELGEKISADYEGKEVKLICILKGSVFFCCELAKRITVPVKIDFKLWKWNKVKWKYSYKERT